MKAQLKNSESGLFLSRLEMAELTDRSRKDDQIRWLKDKGWAFEIGDKGWPKVLRAYAIAKMGGSAHNDGGPKLHLRNAST